MTAYEEMIAATSARNEPWYVIPADNKWYTRLIVAAAIVDTMKEVKPEYPKVDTEQKKQLAAAKAELQKKSR
jgi:hypothetical protein